MEADLDTRCPVCLENWDSAASAMPCRHQFCFPCIRRWTSTRPQCPLCKQGVRSIVHSVQAGRFEELVLRPAAAAPTAAEVPAGPQAARPWAAGLAASPLVGGLRPDTWASLFREHPALLQPLRSWLRRQLRDIFGAEGPEALVLQNSIICTLCLFGLEEAVLVQLLDFDLQSFAVPFVRQFIDVAVQRCGREAHRLLSLNVPPAAGGQQANPVMEPRATAPREEAPVPGPALSSSRSNTNGSAVPGTSGGGPGGHDSRPHSNPTAVSTEPAAPQEEQTEPVAGPSSTSPRGGTRRAPKRKASGSQASAPPRKRPPRRRQ